MQINGLNSAHACLPGLNAFLPVLVFSAITIFTHMRKYMVGRQRLRCSALYDAFLAVFCAVAMI